MIQFKYMKYLINLHANTEYSILESTIKIDSLISAAQKHNVNTLTITDHNVMYGVPKFVKKCNEANIKPIIGLDLDVEDFRLILLAKNYKGYQHLIELSSRKIKGERITINDIDPTDLFIIDHPTLGHYATKEKQLHMTNYFIGLEEGQLPKGVQVIDARTLKQEENKALSILHMIKTGEKKEFKTKPLSFNHRLFEPTMVEQANAIANECNVVFPKKKFLLPTYTTPDNSQGIVFLKKLIKESAKSRLTKIKEPKEYLERIRYEIKVIEALGFADYFLIIWDMVAWAKKNHISVGPGRGSAAGSIISYLLDITEVDPIKHGLLFERFLNPKRVTMPDIDIDIQDDKRDLVVQYMFNKYGSDKTALIITFSKLGAKMSLRDAARTLGILPREVDVLSKSIKLGETLEQTYNTNPKFKANIDRYEKYQELLKSAMSIEGLPRNVGTHAAGIVISNKPIVSSVPTCFGSNDYNQTQYSMDHMESNGLLKIDILGLRNLTIIKKVQKEIYKNHKKRLLLEKINLNDSLTNKLLESIDTNGIFQLESYGMKNTLAQVKINSFDDVSAVISLFRPGPMEFIKTYANRKKGLEKVPLISPEYNQITKNTYGIIVYQEQIMHIAQKFAGMDFAQADILRRAIGKKKIVLIKSLKASFIQGALNKGHQQETIEKVYKAIESFAQYGFNKSHAVSYAIISYRMAFLKARFPLEFYTAILNSSIDSQKAIKTYINEAKAKHIKVISPSINLSNESVYNINKQIVMPLNLIKGLGTVAQNKILEERKENGEYKDFFSFVARVKVVGVGDSVLQSLIGSNALREFGNMQSLLDSLISAIRFSEMITSTKDGKKVIDFNILQKPRLILAKRNIKEEIASEEKLLGFNYNAFYTDAFKTKELLSDLKQKDSVEAAIYVERIFKKIDKNGNTFATIICHDSSNSIEATIFARTWEFIETSKPKKVYIAKIIKKEYKGKIGYLINSPWKEQSE